MIRKIVKKAFVLAMTGMLVLSAAPVAVVFAADNAPAQIKEANDEIIPPKPIEGLEYNGKEQVLVVPGSAGDKKMEYQICYVGYVSKWTTEIPKGLYAVNYEINYRVEGETDYDTIYVRMEPLWVTVTAHDQYSVVGEKIKELTYTIEGLAEGDTEADLGLVEPYTFADKYKPGCYDIVIKMNDTSVNYNVNAVNATYRVMNADLTVSFDSAGGTKIDPITHIDLNEKIKKPADPVREGYTFNGWYYKDKLFDFNLPIITSFTLTAKWTKNEDPDGKKDDPDKKYSNEWVDGQWYDANGKSDYAPKGSWKQNATGWWYEDTSGWYPKSQWQKIDGKWYYFLADGYMDYSEYREGYWLGADGAWVETYYGGHWMQDSTGWWYTDATGWYPKDQWLWIDGVNYYFGANGYL